MNRWQHNLQFNKIQIQIKKEKLSAQNIVLATMPGIDIDEQNIATSTGVLSLSSLPDHLLAVGTVVIGLEMAFEKIGEKQRFKLIDKSGNKLNINVQDCKSGKSGNMETIFADKFYVMKI